MLKLGAFGGEAIHVRCALLVDAVAAQARAHVVSHQEAAHQISPRGQDPQVDPDQAPLPAVAQRLQDVLGP
jgi:hypothetical protein